MPFSFLFFFPFRHGNFRQTINTRWIYHCVQSLLSLRLKPNLMLDGKVDRLSIPTIDGHPESQADFFRLSPASSVPSPISSSVATPSQTSEVAIETWGISDLEDDNNNKNNGRNSNITVEIPVKKEPKTPWSDEDIERMIELKDLEGLTHEEVAVCIRHKKKRERNTSLPPSPPPKKRMTKELIINMKIESYRER